MALHGRLPLSFGFRPLLHMLVDQSQVVLRLVAGHRGIETIDVSNFGLGQQFDITLLGRQIV